MEIEITKKEFEKISYNFRAISSRLLRTNESNSAGDLKRFLNYIHETQLISEFLIKNNIYSFNIEQIVNSRSYYETYDLPVEPKEEISFIYQLLMYCNNENKELTRICSFYGSGGSDRTFDGMVERFNNHVTLAFVTHINTYLAERMIDMKEDGRISITVNGGQVALAQDNGVVNATQTNNMGMQSKEILELISEFKDAVDKHTDINENDKDDAVEMMQLAYEECQSDNPKKSIIRSAISNINSLVALGSAGEKLIITGKNIVEFFNQFIG